MAAQPRDRSSTVVEFQALGQFAVRVGDRELALPPLAKARSLLAYLIVHRKAETPREHLMDLFWPDLDGDRARDNLKTNLWSIRRSFRSLGLDADDFFSAGRATIRWNAPVSCDGEHFAELAAAAGESTDRDALAIYRGDFLDGDYHPWAIAERERLAELYETVLRRRMRDAAGIEDARRLLARNPYDEEAYVVVADFELSAGRHAAALATIERCRAALAEIGGEPSAAFEARFADVAATSPPREFRTPFVGRQFELRCLESALAALRNGNGSTVLIAGTAGIGKSSLLAAFRATPDAAEARVVTVQCIQDDPRPFGPWPTILTTLLGADAEGSMHGGTRGIATALGAALDGKALLVDDAQWLSDEAFGVFAALCRLRSPRNATIVATRPEGLDRLRAALEQVQLTTLSLEPLALDDVTAMLRRATRANQTELAAQLYARTDGHPLFITGIVEALVRDGALRYGGGAWRYVADRGNDIPLPASLHATIKAQLLRRGADAAAIASVLALEPEADFSMLLAAFGKNESRYMDALDDLFATGILLQDPSGPHFAFAHDVLREVAATLPSPARRRAIHSTFAQLLAGSDLPGAHLRRARHLAAAGNAAAAVEAYAAAALETMPWRAWRDAIACVEEANRLALRLESVPSVNAALRLLRRVEVTAYLSTGQPAKSLRAGDDMVRLARAAGDPTGIVQALWARSQAYDYAKEHERGLRDVIEAEAIAREHGDRPRQALMLNGVADTYLALGRLTEGSKAAKRAAAVWRSIERPDGELLATIIGVAALMVAHDVAAARTAFAEGDAAAAQLSWISTVQWRATHAEFAYFSERYDEAATMAQAAIDELQARADEPWDRHLCVMEPGQQRFHAAYFLATVRIAQERYDEALALLSGLRTQEYHLPSAAMSEQVSVLEIDALLRRALPGDDLRAAALAETLGPDTPTFNYQLWVDTKIVARARAAARRHDASAAALVRRALDFTEERARNMPGSSDRVFEQLAVAAGDAGGPALQKRARRLFEDYRNRRRAAFVR
ncbi:MAG: AAA family ATPase [Candidatus Eremiobacteraeota bacterium]|nr:AAA family ATPase [Candidatus Eremiobacteraeota bacterium]